MKRFVRVSASASSRAAEPGDEPDVDLAVSSNSSGETLEAAALPEGLDVNWAQLPQSRHLARWCVARARSVCRRIARVVATTDLRRSNEARNTAGKLHLSRTEVAGRRRHGWASLMRKPRNARCYLGVPTPFLRLMTARWHSRLEATEETTAGEPRERGTNGTEVLLSARSDEVSQRLPDRLPPAV